MLFMYMEGMLDEGLRTKNTVQLAYYSIHCKEFLTDNLQIQFFSLFPNTKNNFFIFCVA